MGETRYILNTDPEGSHSLDELLSREVIDLHDAGSINLLAGRLCKPRWERL